ncbi:MAG: hypothetical protein IT461_04970 [Planctomycetes bacterium]|nr:hypothetical protein [Planctomycetota bacterium]
MVDLEPFSHTPLPTQHGKTATGGVTTAVSLSGTVQLLTFAYFCVSVVAPQPNKNPAGALHSHLSSLGFFMLPGIMASIVLVCYAVVEWRSYGKIHWAITVSSLLALTLMFSFLALAQRFGYPPR